MFKNLQGVEEFRQRQDEIAASRLRQALGLTGSLVSWQPNGEGGWLARLSYPCQDRTIEAIGKSRVAAIQEAVAEFSRRKIAAVGGLTNHGRRF